MCRRPPCGPPASTGTTVQDMADGSDDGDEFEADEAGVPEVLHTVCQLCGGATMIADPKLAIVDGVPRTVDNGRPCPGCGGVGHMPGIVPPV